MERDILYTRKNEGERQKALWEFGFSNNWALVHICMLGLLSSSYWLGLLLFVCYCSVLSGYHHFLLLLLFFSSSPLLIDIIPHNAIPFFPRCLENYWEE
jgi:hypothetical protein